MPKLKTRPKPAKFLLPKTKKIREKIEEALESMYFYDGDALANPVLTPYDPDKMRLNQWFDVDPDDIINVMRIKRMPWQVRYLAFCIGDDGAPYIKEERIDLAEHGLKMSVDDLHNKGYTDMRAFRKRQNPKHLISLAHVATPSQSVDMDDLVQQVLPFLEKEGVYDKLTCELAIESRLKNPPQLYYGHPEGKYA